MKIFRFMSKEEFEKFQKGEILHNTTKHKAKTNSVGFCFLNLEEYNPEYAFHFLVCVANVEMCVVFETEKELNKTYGEYAVPMLPGATLADFIKNFGNSFTANEYCTETYSKNDFKLIKYAEPDFLHSYDEWEWKE